MTNYIWHIHSAVQVAAHLRSTATGLTEAEAGRRLAEIGPNKLPDARVDSWVLIFIRQFQSPLIYILMAAAVAVWLLDDPKDAIIIAAVLLLNAIVGAIQEGRAQNTLLALKKMTVTTATVLRGGKQHSISSEELVPGDVILLHEGDRVPADARILKAAAFKVDQSAITGESVSTKKTSTTLKRRSLIPADQSNMVFKGTHVTRGSATAIVVATGIKTLMGDVAREVSLIKTEIPLVANIRHLSQLVLWIVLGVTLVVVGVGMNSGLPFIEVFKTAIALAVSAVPEGLPIVVTLVLATGVWRMSRRNALVKRLQAVETLGRTDIIAVDKTGTITRNEMVIRKVYVGGQIFDVEGVGYDLSGKVRLDKQIIQPTKTPTLAHIAQLAALGANARPLTAEDGSIRTSGDPTEAAMYVLAAKLGFDKDVLEAAMPQTFEIPFNTDNKYRATIHQTDGGRWLKVIGAPEMVLKLCKQYRGKDGKIQPLTANALEQLENVYAEMSQKGLRILAVAERLNAPETVTAKAMPPLNFVGFFAMYDGLRPQVVESVRIARRAGMRVVMITGDFAITARAIAREAGIYRQGDQVITGEEMEQLDDEQLSRQIAKISVFARVTPQHKLRIVQAYRRQGLVVAMTGDGVNDAPSLVAADLGLGMGRIGTEVAKDASDIVLVDDNIASIISAVEEGRSIYKTLQKVLLYLFSTSIGEIGVILTAWFLGYPLPILAVQILWLNLVTDGFLDVALAMEPKEPGLLNGRPAPPAKYIVDRSMVGRMILMTAVMTVGAIWLFVGKYHAIAGNGVVADQMPELWTMTLTTLAAFQWFNAWNCRHEKISIFAADIFANRFLVGATVAAVGLQLVAIYHPTMQRLLYTTALDRGDWMIILLTAVSIIAAEELRKGWIRARQV
jgi:P-type Ca2+ transporter type 2C